MILILIGSILLNVVSFNYDTLFLIYCRQYLRERYSHINTIRQDRQLQIRYYFLIQSVP